jgi:hypothetical protein
MTSRGALLSDDRRYRYRLWRAWDSQLPVMVWVMLNPSTADATVDDRTTLKCSEFARIHGHGAIIVVNLFAWRSRSPSELRVASDPIGPDNDRHIVWACTRSARVTIMGGWGADSFARRRASEVKRLIGSATHVGMNCLGKTKNGHPEHPLFVPYASPIMPL